MKKVFSIILSTTLIISVFAGCNNTPSTPSTASTTVASSSSVERIKMRVAYMPNMNSASTMITAIKMGYFNEQGIDVEPVKFEKGPEEIAAMGSGNIDVSQIGHGAHALCAKGQARIFTIDSNSNSDEVLANKEKGINGIADLKGKKVATSLGTSSEIILNLALQSVGMTEKDITIVQMDPASAVTAMVTGKVDACAIWSPSTITVKEKMGDKCISLAANKTFSDKVVFPSSWICTNDYYAKNQDKLVRFTSALLKAQDYKKAHLEEVSGWLATLIEQDPATLKKSTGEGIWLSSDEIYKMAKDGTLKVWYENQQKLFLQSKALEVAVDVSKYYSPDIITKAYVYRAISK